jgi:hypothetical protein
LNNKNEQIFEETVQVNGGYCQNSAKFGHGAASCSGSTVPLPRNSKRENRCLILPVCNRCASLSPQYYCSWMVLRLQQYVNLDFSEDLGENSVEIRIRSF